MNRIAHLCRRVVLAAVIVAVGGCVALEPHRYRLPVAGVDCADARANEACRHAIVERTTAYDLHFVEFDDQGLQYPDTMRPADWHLDAADVASEGCDLSADGCLHRRAWAYQINNVVKALNAAAAEQPITLLVFVHGWKHDARADDGNVESFRRLLADMAFIEDHRQTFEEAAGGRPSPKRRVVGLYVGWRGAAVDVPGLEELTFWSRKNAAMRVAEGSSRELFARLRGFRCVQNTKTLPRAARDCSAPPSRDDAVKIILIGHSFGGLILYNAVSGSLIESMTHAFDASDRENPRYWRFADLTVLINPAFEAVRYAPLERIAATSRYERYEPPLLVTVTSTTDTATGFWFRLGRFANTLLERHVDAEEEDANRETVGHHASYVTHRLEVNAATPAACDGWQQVEPGAPEARRITLLGRDLAIEYNNSRAFFRSSGEIVGPDLFRMKRDVPWVREFCGGVRLSVTGTDPNSPIWNVRAIGDATLLPNHSDISEPRFVGFFRQLYMDTIFLDHMVEGARPATVPP